MASKIGSVIHKKEGPPSGMSEPQSSQVQDEKYNLVNTSEDEGFFPEKPRTSGAVVQQSGS